MDKILEEMNDEYQDGKNHEKIYCPQLHLPCAVQLPRGDWYRGVIAEVIEQSKVRGRLVDKGRMELFELKQLRVLDERLFTSNELTYECSLADSEPSIGIISPEHFRYKVNLYIVKRSINVSVNALLVLIKHGISTGYDPQELEIAKENIFEDLLKVRNDKDADVLAAKVRTKLEIKIVHIETPGSFTFNYNII